MNDAGGSISIEEQAISTIITQNDVIIALLARSVLGRDAIHDMVVKGKRDPASYVKAYNGLDGSIGVTDAARLAGVSQPTMTTILKNWEYQGIVFNAGTSRRPLYKRLLGL